MITPNHNLKIGGEGQFDYVRRNQFDGDSCILLGKVGMARFEKGEKIERGRFEVCVDCVCPTDKVEEFRQNCGWLGIV